MERFIEFDHYSYKGRRALRCHLAATIPGGVWRPRTVLNKIRCIEGCTAYELFSLCTCPYIAEFALLGASGFPRWNRTTNAHNHTQPVGTAIAYQAHSEANRSSTIETRAVGNNTTMPALFQKVSSRAVPLVKITSTTNAAVIYAGSKRPCQHPQLF